jgi:hypothetical protein
MERDERMIVYADVDKVGQQVIKQQLTSVGMYFT